MPKVSRAYSAVIMGLGIGALGIAMLAFPSPAKPAVSIIGASFAHDCYVAAKLGAPADPALELCTRSIEMEPLSRRDLSGTYVNRGILYMEARSYKAAQQDFQHALGIDPNLGEAVVNLGGALIAQHRFADGVAQITRGLTLNPEEPEKAFFNRALGYEGLDDLKAAYLDYQKAAQLKPTWPAPQTELARFTVATKGR
ncbi:MAG: tetratricopeptide repeat protein [Caulobacteraceae bacterium]|nr:tetratricopeptide repeat protein [Caulobacteraceae bacterium]